RVDPARPEPRDTRAREVRSLLPSPVAVREHVEALRACPERVRLRVAPVHQAVARPDLVRAAVLPRQARAAEHEEDLLRGAVHMRRRGPLLRRDLDPSQAHADRPGGGSEVGPHRIEVAGAAVAWLDVVPVRDPHAADYRARAAAVSARGGCGARSEGDERSASSRIHVSTRYVIATTRPRSN